MNNNARQFADAPADIRALGLFIPDLTARRREIGSGVASGSSYVIAELDGAYTKYQEATVEVRMARRSARSSAAPTPRASTAATSTRTTPRLSNDANIFIGSSLIADGPGRQLWNFRDGRLRGDRPHMLKLYGFYSCTGMRRSARSCSRSRVSRGRRGDREPYHRLSDGETQRQRHVHRASRVAPVRRARAARPELHPEHPAQGPLHGCS